MADLENKSPEALKATADAAFAQQPMSATLLLLTLAIVLVSAVFSVYIERSFQEPGPFDRDCAPGFVNLWNLLGCTRDENLAGYAPPGFELPSFFGGRRNCIRTNLFIFDRPPQCSDYSNTYKSTYINDKYSGDCRWAGNGLQCR